MMFTVVVTEKGGTRQLMKFEEELISIGRVQGNEIVLPRGNVSKRHAKIELKSNRFRVVDLGSTNGTYLNGRRVTESAPIYHDDKVYIGDYIIEVQDHEGLLREDSAGRDPGPQVEKDEQEEAPAPPKPRISTETVKLPEESGRDDHRGSRRRIPRPAVVSKPLKKPEPPPEPDAPAVEESELDLGDDDELVIGVSEVPEPEPEPEAPKAAAELEELLETVIEQVARKVKRVDRSRIPARLDEGTAGNVRIVAREVIDDLERRGKLPPSVVREELEGKLFRAVVDLGPLAGWLDDPEVRSIRLIGSGSAVLLKGGDWSDTPSGYTSNEEVSAVVHCLGAGRESRGGGASGLAWYRLEEGYLVFAALPPGSEIPALIIDKVALGVGTGDVVPEKAGAVLAEALDARARVAVVGSTGPGRLAVVDALTTMLPKDAFTVTVEDVPLVAPSGPQRIRLRPGKREGGARGGIPSVLSHAFHLDASWIVIAGSSPTDLPAVLSAAASRLGVLADLPLGAVGPLARELTLAMTAAGAPVDPGAAAALLEEAFDLIVVVRRGSDGTPAVSEVLASATSEAGEWAPRSLFTADKKG